MRRKQKKWIINGLGISLLALILIAYAWLALFSDPTIERVIDTGNPRTSLTIIEHTKTGEKEYIYGVVDGVGAVKKP